MKDSETPTDLEHTQAMPPLEMPTGVPELPKVEPDPLDTGDTLEVGGGTVMVSNKDGIPYKGGSSPQGYVTSEDSAAFPIGGAELVEQLQKEVLNGTKSREEAEEAVKAFAKDHNYPTDGIKLTF